MTLQTRSTVSSFRMALPSSMLTTPAQLFHDHLKSVMGDRKNC